MFCSIIKILFFWFFHTSSVFGILLGTWEDFGPLCFMTSPNSGCNPKCEISPDSRHRSPRHKRRSSGAGKATTVMKLLGSWNCWGKAANSIWFEVNYGSCFLFFLSWKLPSQSKLQVLNPNRLTNRKAINSLTFWYKVNSISSQMKTDAFASKRLGKTGAFKRQKKTWGAAPPQGCRFARQNSAPRAQTTTSDNGAKAPWRMGTKATLKQLTVDRQSSIKKKGTWVVDITYNHRKNQFLTVPADHSTFLRLDCWSRRENFQSRSTTEASNQGVWELQQDPDWKMAARLQPFVQSLKSLDLYIFFTPDSKKWHHWNDWPTWPFGFVFWKSLCAMHIFPDRPINAFPIAQPQVFVPTLGKPFRMDPSIEAAARFRQLGLMSVPKCDHWGISWEIMAWGHATSLRASASESTLSFPPMRMDYETCLKQTSHILVPNLPGVGWLRNSYYSNPQEKKPITNCDCTAATAFPACLWAKVWRNG